MQVIIHEPQLTKQHRQQDTKRHLRPQSFQTSQRTLLLSLTRTQQGRLQLKQTKLSPRHHLHRNSQRAMRRTILRSNRPHPTKHRNTHQKHRATSQTQGSMRPQQRPLSSNQQRRHHRKQHLIRSTPRPLRQLIPRNKVKFHRQSHQRIRQPRGRHQPRTNRNTRQLRLLTQQHKTGVLRNKRRHLQRRLPFKPLPPSSSIQRQLQRAHAQHNQKLQGNHKPITTRLHGQLRRNHHISRQANQEHHLRVNNLLPSRNQRQLQRRRPRTSLLRNQRRSLLQKQVQ